MLLQCCLWVHAPPWQQVPARSRPLFPKPVQLLTSTESLVAPLQSRELRQCPAGARRIFAPAAQARPLLEFQSLSASLQSREFRHAQQVALEVLLMAATALDLTERLDSSLGGGGARSTASFGSTLGSTMGSTIGSTLGSSLGSALGAAACPSGAPSTQCDSPTSCLSGASSPPARPQQDAQQAQQQRLLAVASACRSLLTGGPVQAQALRGSMRSGGGRLGGSALVPGLLAGYAVALELAEEVEVRSESSGSDLKASMMWWCGVVRPDLTRGEGVHRFDLGFSSGIPPTTHTVTVAHHRCARTHSGP